MYAVELVTPICADAAEAATAREDDATHATRLT
jgi:hypothetical protein